MTGRQRSASASATSSCRSCPMFHANAWGLAHAAVAVRRRPRDARARPLAARRIADLIDRGAGHGRRRRAHDLDGRAARARRAATRRSLRAIPCGGSAVPKALSEALPRAARPADPAGLGDDRDQPGRLGRPASSRRSPTLRPRTSWPTCAPRVGLALLGVDFRVVEPDDRRAAARGTARARGELQVPRAVDRRRPTTTTTAPASRSPTTAGCAPATSPRSTPEGYIRLVDRTKDLIKSGGEWICSVELENEIMAHPKVAEAAVIGVPAPEVGASARWPASWSKAGRGRSTTEEVLDFLDGRGRQVVAARRRRVHRRGAEDLGRQVLQEDPARALRRLPAPRLSPSAARSRAVAELRRTRHPIARSAVGASRSAARGRRTPVRPARALPAHGGGARGIAERSEQEPAEAQRRMATKIS